jgi:hypothetical protein
VNESRYHKVVRRGLAGSLGRYRRSLCEGRSSNGSAVGRKASVHHTKTVGPTTFDYVRSAGLFLGLKAPP